MWIDKNLIFFNSNEELKNHSFLREWNFLVSLYRKSNEYEDYYFMIEIISQEVAIVLKKKRRSYERLDFFFAERKGFEPSVQLPAH